MEENWEIYLLSTGNVEKKVLISIIFKSHFFFFFLYLEI